ncbi:MAG: P-loop NTPase fold protein [Pseudomonadota bacterium]
MQPDTQERRWIERVQLLDDGPLGHETSGRQDLLGFAGLVRLAAGSIRRAKGPMVVHVDGGWGFGKTSFCQLLERELEAPAEAARDAAVEVCWYIASDDDGDPERALMGVIAQGIARGDPEEARRILRTWFTSAGDPASTDGSLEAFRRWVGRELGWRGHAPVGEAPAKVSIPLPSGARMVLEVPPTQRRMVVIMVDDLDRCAPEQVQGVLRAVRALVTCDGLSFVVAADRQVIDAAFHHAVEGLGAADRLRASDALEKYVRHHVHLPRLADLDSALRTERMKALEAQLFPGSGARLLWGPGAALQDGVAAGLAFYFHDGFTLRRLKRVLNRIAVEAARGADRCGLRAQHLLDTGGPVSGGIWDPRRLATTRLGFEDAVPTDPDRFPAWFVGRVVLAALDAVWPGALHPDPLQRAERINALAALGANLESWPPAVLEAVLDTIAPPIAGEVTTAAITRRQACRFLADVTAPFTAMPATTPTTSGAAGPGPDLAPVVTHESMVEAPAPIASGPEAFGPAPESPLTVEEVRAEAAALEEALMAPREAIAVEALRTQIDRLLGLLDLPQGRDAVPSSLVRRGAYVVSDRMFAFASRPLVLARLAEQAFQRGETNAGHGMLAAAISAVAEVAPPSGPPPLELLPVMAIILQYLEPASANNGALIRLTEGLLFEITERELADPAAFRFATACARVYRGRVLPTFNEELWVSSMRALQRQYVDDADLDEPRARLRALRFSIAVDRAVPPPVHNAIIASQGSEEATGPGVLARRELADWLAASNSGRWIAAELYTSLRRTSEWTPDTLHNHASLLLAMNAPRDQIGRLWELAYRAGGRDGRMLRAFSDFLTKRGFPRPAMRVLNGQPLDEGWHPFGEDPPQHEVRPYRMEVWDDE